MKNYVICTDSACDIPVGLLSDWGVSCIDMTFHMSETAEPLRCGDMAAKEFYDKMREGRAPKTAAINPYTFRGFFEQFLKQGLDVLYLCFSSGLSSTYPASLTARDELMEEYPERRILVVDTLCASGGQGLLVYLTAKMSTADTSIEDAAAFAEKTKHNLCHWFTVDDLEYLKRGGRISSATAFAGTVLGIKPVLHVDPNGLLVNVSKVRGRKAALRALAEAFNNSALDKKNGTIFIVHADCEDDARLLGSWIESANDTHITLITEMGPIIGSHVGPGTMALFFVGSER